MREIGSITVPIKPMGAPRPRVTRYGTHNPKAYTEYKEAIRLAWVAKHKGYPVDGPVAMFVTFFFSVPKSWTKRRKAAAGWHTSRPDADNLLKSVKDALNGVAYKDDAQVCMVSMSKTYGECDMVVIDLHEMEP